MNIIEVFIIKVSLILLIIIGDFNMNKERIPVWTLIAILLLASLYQIFDVSFSVNFEISFESILKISLTIVLSIIFLWNLMGLRKDYKIFKNNQDGFENARNENLNKLSSAVRFFTALLPPKEQNPEGYKEGIEHINYYSSELKQTIKEQDEKVTEFLQRRIDTRKEIAEWILKYIDVIGILWLNLGTWLP